jgi:hypothetical protein
MRLDPVLEILINIVPKAAVETFEEENEEVRSNETMENMTVYGDEDKLIEEEENDFELPSLMKPKEEIKKNEIEEKETEDWLEEESEEFEEKEESKFLPKIEEKNE